MESTAEFRQKLMDRYGKEHLSYSSLKHALGDMRYFDMYMKGEIYKDSPALKFGSMYDMFLFEPEKAREKYIIVDPEIELQKMPSSVLSSSRPTATKLYKEHIAEIEMKATEEDKITIPVGDYNDAMRMIDRLRVTGLYRDYLEGCEFQVEMIKEIDGILIKGYIDALGSDMIIDSKSSRSINKFRYDVGSFCYDIQAFLYTKAMGIDKFYWLVQEKTYPFYPGIVRCTDETLFSGEMKFNEAIGNIATFLDRGDDYDFGKHYAEFSV